jgi:hypothetical protein
MLQVCFPPFLHLQTLRMVTSPTPTAYRIAATPAKRLEGTLALKRRDRRKSIEQRGKDLLVSQGSSPAHSVARFPTRVNPQHPRCRKLSPRRSCTFRVPGILPYSWTALLSRTPPGVRGPFLLDTCQEVLISLGHSIRIQPLFSKWIYRRPLTSFVAR